MSRTFARLLLPLALFAALPETPIARAENLVLETRPVRWRLGGENVRLPGGENMGLASIHYDLFGLVPSVPQLYVGVGGFGAVAGRRGGFFVGGVDAGWRQRLTEGLHLEAGVFAGGGGGSGGPQGGGLMIRPMVGIEQAVGDVAVRAEISRVLFPNGEIRSTDLLLGVSIPADRVAARAPASGEDAPSGSWERRPERVQAGWMRYLPRGGSRKVGGGVPGDAIDLAGLEYDIFLDHGFFIPLAAYGAFRGGAAGYMTVLGGVGARRYIDGAWWADLRLLAGAGGGGSVDTGGGVLLQPMAGIGRRFPGGWTLSADGGFTYAPDGPFRAPTFRLTGGREVEAFRPVFAGGDRGPVVVPDDAAVPDPWAFSVGNKTYRPRGGVRNKAGQPAEGTVQLVCGGVEKPLLAWLSVAGRGCSAWDGGVGGYSEGLFDVKVQTAPFPSFPGHVLGARLGGGAGGGGGMDVGSGLVGEAAVGWRYAIRPDLSVFVQAGRMDARQGTFSADFVEFGVRGSLRRAVAR